MDTEPFASNEAVRGALLDIERACGQFIDRETEDPNLGVARSLIMSVLMRSCGITPALQKPTVATLWDAREKIQVSFGAPGDWGGPLCLALRKLYAFRMLVLAEFKT